MTSKTGKVYNAFVHAYERPDAYIGSVKTTKRETYIFQEAQEEDKAPLIVLKKINYNQGLLRLFIEAMSNAIDNKWRSEQHKIPMKKIDFILDNDPDSETFGWITVTNDGYCIPVEKTEYEFSDLRTKKERKEMLYPAEVFFGEMLAGTNFEEDDTRKTSGRNGMGGKIDVIFSTEFFIEHTNPEQGKKFVQKYRNNGKERDKPVITSYKGKVGYTTISFHPDYEYFGYKGMDSDLFGLFKRYIYECSMITGLTVTLNKEKIFIKDLSKYVRLFFPDTKANCCISFKAPNGDECVLIEKSNPEHDTVENISHVSWVNGINTGNGGLHVEAWKNVLCPAIVKAFNARKPKKGEKDVLKSTAKEIYPYLTLFVRAELAGAKFQDQTKDELTEPEVVLCQNKSKKTEFSKEISEAVKKVLKWNFVTLLEEKLAMRAERNQAKKEGSTKKRIVLGDRGEEANFAGTKDAAKCTLWITEGNSAKTFAKRLISGLPNGTDYNGVFALKGKFINVQNASQRDVNANVEVKLLKEMLRLMSGADYSDPGMRKLLRYGRIVIAADQDDDGFHIRGLVLNFLWHGWPSLFDLRTFDDKCFVCSLSTAVVMARSGKGKNKKIQLFYSNPEFKRFAEKGIQKGVDIEYYKGLGTHGPGDEKLYLNDPKQVQYVLDGEEKDYMILGFKGGADASNWRKTWITRDITKPGELAITEDNTSPITIDGELSLSTFVDTQLIIYHIMALRRALPNMYDGFKESQRKAFYGIMMDPDARKKKVNLENLVGSVKKMTGYHHGGVSLEQTIKKMAQGFVGSNNIPPLTNEGEFGSRSQGGQDAAAARYIHTRLEDISWLLFSEMDEPILKKAREDDKEVEFELFMPILPTILINGADGIASGFSTGIPCYNPEDLATWIEKWLDSEEVDMPALVPWYRGFTGEIELIRKDGKGKTAKNVVCKPGEKATGWRSKGILKETKKGWWRISELPIGMWTDTMKEYLEYMLTGNPPEGSKKKKGERYLSDIRWKGTANTAVWDIKPMKDFIPDMNVRGNFNNMQTVFSLTNMHVIDENNYPRKYSSPEELLKDFCVTRLDFYVKRRNYWLREYQKNFDRESDRYIFVKAVIDGKLKMKQEPAKLEASMLALGLRKVDSKGHENFDYLLSMQMRSIMSADKLEEIKKEVDRIKAKLDDLKSKTPTDLWKSDIAAFRVAYEKFLKTRKEE